MAHMVETAFYAKEPAWHGLGTVVSDTLSSHDALVAANLNWAVNPEPIYLSGNLEIEGKKANVRNTDRKVLGIVSDKYKVVQNEEAFSFIDELLENDIEPVRFESAGSLDEGKRVWMLAHLPGRVILGDEIIPYIVLANSHDGSMAVTCAMTPTRVVCQNTLTMALNNASRSWSIRHMGDIKGKREDAARTLRLAVSYMGKLEETAEDFQQRKLTKESLNAVLDIMFPTDEENTNRKNGNILDQKEQFLRVYASALVSDLAKFKGDAWGLYNGFADFAAHSEPLRETKNFRENRFASFIDGNKFLDRAQKAIEKVTA